MANINDFKILTAVSINYFKTFSNELVEEEHLKDLNETEMARFGFNFLMIEKLTGIRDFSDIEYCITDTEFNSRIYGKKFDDYGIDAIVIEEDKKKINLFNFKYREKFNYKEQNTNETLLSSKFINAIANNNIHDMKGKIRHLSEKVLEMLNGTDIWELNLFAVSNEEFQNTPIEEHLKQFQENYDLQIKKVGLQKISELISLRPEPVNSTIILDKEAVMSYSENTMSSSKSYIFRLPLSELIRITCKNEDLRNEYNIENVEQLSNEKLNIAVLFDNVRGFVMKSKYNKNISESIKNNPEKFFMLNNGLTLIADDIIGEPVNANRKVKIELNNFQILNGGQTLRTIHSFNSKDPKNITEYLASAEVLIRVFKTQKNSDLNSQIAESTNSQNQISNVDLKSLRREQINLEQYLEQHNILYSRKTGDTGEAKNKSYKYQISMEKFGQILMSVKGSPEKATNDKKNIFDKFYNDLFTDNSTLIEEAVDNVNLFFNIRKKYKIQNLEVSDQKIFYVLHIIKSSNKVLNISQSITLLEDTIKTYKSPTGKAVSDARKLIQKAFKAELDKKIKATLENNSIS